MSTHHLMSVLFLAGHWEPVPQVVVHTPSQYVQTARCNSIVEKSMLLQEFMTQMGSC